MNALYAFHRSSKQCIASCSSLHDFSVHIALLVVLRVLSQMREFWLNLFFVTDALILEKSIFAMNLDFIDFRFRDDFWSVDMIFTQMFGLCGKR